MNPSLKPEKKNIKKKTISCYVLGCLATSLQLRLQVNVQLGEANWTANLGTVALIPNTMEVKMSTKFSVTKLRLSMKRHHLFFHDVTCLFVPPERKIQIAHSCCSLAAPPDFKVGASAM